MKAFGTILLLLSIVALNGVNAVCSRCKETLDGTWFEGQGINGGPCFQYGGDTIFCMIKNTTNKVVKCSKDDLLCKLTDKTVEDCGSPSNSEPLGVHGGTPGQCDPLITINNDCKVDTDYYKCRFGEAHTMAKYGCGAGSNCKDVCSYGFSSQDEIDAIVFKHNELRAKVANCNEKRAYNSDAGQPCARNMNKLTWDPELAKVAQRWAQACDGYHDKDRSVHGYHAVGQNYAASWASSLSKLRSPQDSIQAWYDEVKDMSPNAVSHFSTSPPYAAPGKAIGHYTQVVWATTTRVGCGRIVYKHSPSLYAEAFVCNYGEAGNWSGSSIYQIASSPADVGHGCPGATEDGLCA